MSQDATTASRKIWITGAGGLIGSYLARLAPEGTPPGQVKALTRADLDLTDFASVKKRFNEEHPRLILHCAAMSKSPDCQARPALARKINVEATALLSGLAAEDDFIFFSTDLVFNGKKGNYVETDAVHPLSIYGETKVEAEAEVLKNPRHMIVRTSLNSGHSPTGQTAYNEQIRAAWAAGQSVKLFHDEFRCPLSASVTARALWNLAAHPLGGIWHLAGGERLSRLQIGQLLAARHPELAARLESCSLRAYQGPPRPADTSLNCAKIQQHLSCRLPGLQGWLLEQPHDEF